MKRDSESAAVEPQKTKCQFKFLWGPEPCKVFYVENDECPCPTSKYRSYFTRKVSCLAKSTEREVLFQLNKPLCICNH